MKRLMTAIAAGIMATAMPAAAQNYGNSNSTPVHAGSVEVPVNKSQVLTSDVPIDRAMIGNDEIADVLPISDRSVYVLGKDNGTTSLTLYDRGNRVIAVMDIVVGPDIVGLRQSMGELMPGETIQARLSNGSIILSGVASDPGAASQAVELARAYVGDPGKVVNLMTLGGSQQVMLEVRFVEVSRSVGKELGVSSFQRSTDGLYDGGLGDGVSLSPNADTGIGEIRLNEITGSFGIFRRIFTDVAGLNIEAILDTLEERGFAKTLAEPTLIALSGERASFLAGGEFPIPVVQDSGAAGGSSSISVEFKPFGVSLGFTPTVLGDGVINLVVEPEVSSIDPNASINVNGLNIPGLQTRRASTVLELRDGESFAIAGLLQRDFQSTVRQIPILGSIPIIGTLFRSTDFQKGETELMIVVTPRLVAPIRPEQVRTPADRVGDPNEADLFFNGNAYNPQELEPIPGETPATAAEGGDDYEY